MEARAVGANVSHSYYVGNIFNQPAPSGLAVFVNSDNKLGTVMSSRRFKEDIKRWKTSEAILGLQPESQQQTIAQLKLEQEAATIELKPTVTEQQKAIEVLTPSAPRTGCANPKGERTTRCNESISGGHNLTMQ
jgi:hypothetical protein